MCFIALVSEPLTLIMKYFTDFGNAKRTSINLLCFSPTTTLVSFLLPFLPLSSSYLISLCQTFHILPLYYHCNSFDFISSLFSTMSSTVYNYATCYHFPITLFAVSQRFMSSLVAQSTLHDSFLPPPISRFSLYYFHPYIVSPALFQPPSCPHSLTKQHARCKNSPCTSYPNILSIQLPFYIFPSVVFI